MIRTVFCLYTIRSNSLCEVEGRGGKERRFFSHTCRSLFDVVWWKGGVENDGLGRRICMLLDQRHIARTRTGTKSNVWWKGGVEKNGFLFAHVPEPLVIAWWKGGVEKNGFLFAHVPEPLGMWGKRAGWKRKGFLFAHVPEPLVM